MTMKHSVKLKCLKMHRSFLNLIGHGVVMECNRKMTVVPDFWWALYVSTKLTLDVMGQKITTLSKESVNHSTLLNLNPL